MLRILIAAAFLITFSVASAVILISTGDPAQNTTAPSGVLAGSGWQYEGSFGSFLGTAIDPHHFITVQHIGVASNTFVYQGANYTIVQSFDDTESDLRIFEVAETFPSYAPLYSRTDELGQSLVVIGRGTQRGDPVLISGIIHGWYWGAGDGVQRWGESQVSKLQGNYLYCTFNQVAGPNEAHLSSGDSGGAAFINDGGIWKLAGIHYGVDGPFLISSGDTPFYACLFDMRGLFDSTTGYVIAGTNPVPSGFYSIRISERLSWIASIAPLAAPSPTPTPTSTPTPTPPPAPSSTPGASIAQMISPVPGSILSSARMTFTWGGGSASVYKLLVGTAPGVSNIYSSGKVSARSATVRTLPTNGSTVYVRLSSLVGSNWRFADYTYSSATASSTPTPSPRPTGTPRRGGGGN